MVLVDVSHEDEVARMPDQMRNSYLLVERAEVPLLRLGGVLARFGIMRLAVSREWVTLLEPFKVLPEPERTMAFAYRVIPSFFRTAAREDILYPRSGEQARHAGPIGDKPLIVLTGAGMDESGKSPLPITGESLRESISLLAPIKRELHEELARRLSPQGEHIVTEQSGHLIQLSEPDLVADAIWRVVTLARARV
jgi:pimeloyl-ACP methyl ester carboxylesterase